MHALLSPWTPYTDDELAARLAALVAAETARQDRTVGTRGPAGKTGRTGRETLGNKGIQKKIRKVTWGC